MKVTEGKIMGTDIKRLLNAILIAFCLGTILISAAPAQSDSTKSAVEVVEGFLDEDGDGFNDLLPDSDGDGIPDLIDPDFKGHKAESLYTNRYRMNAQEQMQNREMIRLMYHGEPGQYGPNDTTGHGGHQGGGGGHGNGGGHGGGGDMGGGMDGGSKILPGMDNKKVDVKLPESEKAERPKAIKSDK